MLAIMAEESREGVRKRLRESTSITVAWDESDGRKIFRARCDTPDYPYRYDCVLGVLTKRLGEFRRVVEEVSEDHAALTHKYLVSFHKRFFTRDAGVGQFQSSKRNGPYGRLDCGGHSSRPAVVDSSRQTARSPASSQPGAISDGSGRPAVAKRKKRQRPPIPLKLDEEAHQSYRNKVRVLASDGGKAERRALFCSGAGEYFPNVAMAIKDMTHTIRIATATPMQLVGVYEDVYEEILNKKHALIPDISNSNKWQNVLHAIQKEVLCVPSLKGPGCLDVVLGHLKFAKQRMDSSADPLAKVCLMLMPIALLLASISSDERVHKDQRNRASSILSKMQPKFLHAMGVSADWGIISISLLRKFDAGDHDISNSADEFDDFEETIKCLFVNGGVFHKVSAGASASGDVDGRPEFITSRVRRQTQRRCVFRCGSTANLAWGPLKESDLTELSMNTRVAAEAMLERLRADAVGLRLDFACFSLQRMSIALGGDAARGAKVRRTLVSSVRTLGHAFKLDKRILELEYTDAMPVILKHWKEMSNLDIKTNNGKSFSNLIVWRKLLDGAFVDKAFTSRQCAFVVLPVLLRIWIGILDGESMVERDFAHVRDFVRQSKTTNGMLLDDLTVLKLSGPQDPSELCHRAACGDLVAKPFLIRCVEKWRRFYTARYGLSNNGVRNRRPDKGDGTVKRVAAKSRPTFAGVKRGVLRAARCVTVAARSGSTSSMTPYGVSERSLRAPRAEKKEHTSVWNDKMKHFSELSAAKKILNEQYRFGRSAFPKWKERSGCLALTPHPVMSRLVFLPGYTSAACGADSIESIIGMGYQVRDGVDCCEKASLVIIDHLERFHGSCPAAEWLVHLTYIVGYGITVTTASCCASVVGNVRHLPRSDLIEHRPACEVDTTFFFEDDFKLRHPLVVSAVKACAASPKSQWSVVKKKIRAPVTTASRAVKRPPEAAIRKRSKKKLYIEVAGLESCWQSLLSLRRVRNIRTAPLVWRDDRVCVEMTNA